MTRDELRQAFPIEGRQIRVGEKTWMVRVRDIVDASNVAFRVAIEFEGPDKYTATLNRDKQRLTAPQNNREVDLLLEDVARWLQTDPRPPRGHRTDTAGARPSR